MNYFLFEDWKDFLKASPPGTLGLDLFFAALTPAVVHVNSLNRRLEHSLAVNPLNAPLFPILIKSFLFPACSKIPFI